MRGLSNDSPFLLYRKYRVTLKRESDDPYRAKALRKANKLASDARLAE